MPSPTSNTDDRDNVSVAVDFGGTKIAVARIVADEFVDKRHIATDQAASPDAQFATIVELIDSLKGDSECVKIGVAVCGRIDAQGQWHAVNQATLRDLAAFPLQARLEAQYQSPVCVMNDGVASAWGEYVFRSRSEPVGTLLYMTVSTGIGGGLVIDGKPLVSAHGLAGHIGFMRSPLATEACHSGRAGTLETVASGTSIGRRGSTAEEPGLSGFDVYQRHLSGNAAATAVVDASAQAVAVAIADVTALLDIDLVAIGGGIGLAVGYIERVRRHLDDEPAIFRPEVFPALLGPDSALLGVVS